MSNQTQAIARRETDILPRLTDDAIAAVSANIKQFEKFKQSVLSEKDYTWMGDNQYIEKSGWVKMRMAMNCSFEILDEGRRIVGNDDEGEYYTWIFKGRATAPSGVFLQMDGACSSRDDFFSMRKDDEGNPIRRRPSEIDEKDIIVTAQTNCFNRCMSFLCGFGELSGEEMRGKQFEKKTVRFPFPDEIKGKMPAECDLATLKKYLPTFEKAANDPKNKWADQNKKLVAAINEAIAEKIAKPESSPPSTTESAVGPESALAGVAPEGGESNLAVEDWKRELAEADSLEKLAALWKTLSQEKVWSNFKGPEQVAMKREHDKRKSALMEQTGKLV